MSYLVVKNKHTKKLKDLRKEDWDLAKKNEAILINLTSLSYYDNNTDNWIYILTIQDTNKKNVTKKTLERNDFIKIRTIAHDFFMQKGVEVNAQEYMRDYLLFSALEEYLHRNKIDPGFTTKKP